MIGMECPNLVPGGGIASSFLPRALCFPSRFTLIIFRHGDNVGKYIYIYLDPPRGAKWMVRGATKQPLGGFKHHPLEGAGINYIRVYEGAPPSYFAFFPS